MSKKTKNKPRLYNSISQRAAIGGWVYYAFELLFLPSLLLTFQQGLGLSDAVVNFIYYCLNFTFLSVIFRRFLAGSLECAGKNLGRFLLAVAVAFLGCWGVSTGMGVLMGWLVPGFVNVNDQSIAAMFREHPVLIAVGTILLVPTAEECVFRGLVFSQLYPKSKKAAYAVTVLGFCAIHVLGYVGAYPAATLALCFLQYIPSGLLLCWAYSYSGTIIAPILAHAAVNLVAVLGLL